MNLRGVFLGLRAAFRQYASQEGGGAVVVVGSIGSLRGSDDLVPYHASKHGVIGLMRSAAVHGGERGVRVNAVAPGHRASPTSWPARPRAAPTPSGGHRSPRSAGPARPTRSPT